MTDTTTPVDNETRHSPVTPSQSSALRLWMGKIIGGLAALVILYLFFHDSHTKQEAVVEKPPAPPVTVTAPQLPLSKKDVDKINEALKNIDKEPSRDEREDTEKLEKMRNVAPSMVFSNDTSSQIGAGSDNSTKPDTTGMNEARNGVFGSDSPNAQFMTNVSHTSTPTEQATHILHPSTTLAQGAIIWATLETRISSDLPGMVRAVSSEDIYSEDGSTVLIPKGSRLIGQYSDAIAQAQRRVFVVWQRAIRPDNIDIQLGSPGTDRLGGAGFEADSVDHHFFAQFGTAALLSIIGAGAANVGINAQDQFNSAASYRQALASSFAQTAQSTLQATGVIKPTLTIDQGKLISVFVAKDLDFYNELHGK